MCSDPNLLAKLSTPNDACFPNTTMCFRNEPFCLLCDDYIPAIKSSVQTWQPYGYSPDYCLSERLPENCGLHVNLVLIWIVVSCNIVKIAAMLLVALRDPGKKLVTIGDAISSFLENPDPTTIGHCLLDEQSLIKTESLSQDPDPKEWKPQQKRVFHAASKRHWVICIFL